MVSLLDRAATAVRQLLDRPVRMVASSAPRVWRPEVARTWDGERFPGGFGPTELWQVDYQTLRARSWQLIRSSLHARGLLRRLLTNEINTGLMLDAQPLESILGMPDGELDGWSEGVEARFHMWAQRKDLCDYHRAVSFYELERVLRREGLGGGDCLVVQHLDEYTQLPRIQLIAGERVVSPLQIQRDPGDKTEIVEGVELDRHRRQVAYWVQQDDQSIVRIPAYGKTGRRMAWLYYGTDRRHGEVRGEPLLGLVLQSLRELERYRDAALRKAVINSLVALFIQRNQSTQAVTSVSGSPIRAGSTEVVDSDGVERKLRWADHMPGAVFDQLQPGETLVPFNQGAGDIDYPKVESATLHAIAWAHEIPPDVLQLSFGHNYAASQAAIYEFTAYLKRVRHQFAAEFCEPIYQEWLIGEALSGRLPRGSEVLAHWQDDRHYAEWGAWTNSAWVGVVKPSTDMLKTAKAYDILTAKGWATNAEASAMQMGGDWRQRIRTLRRENELIVEANRPLREFEASLAMPAPAAPPADERDEELDDELDNRDPDSVGGDPGSGNGGA